MIKRRLTDLTDEQRRALDVARHLLIPHFPGETVKLYVPRSCNLDHVREERDRRIEAALAAGDAPEVIVRREDVSKRHLRRIRARIGSGW